MDVEIYILILLCARGTVTKWSFRPKQEVFTLKKLARAATLTVIPMTLSSGRHKMALLLASAQVFLVPMPVAPGLRLWRSCLGVSKNQQTKSVRVGKAGPEIFPAPLILFVTVPRMIILHLCYALYLSMIRYFSQRTFSCLQQTMSSLNGLSCGKKLFLY